MATLPGWRTIELFGEAITAQLSDRFQDVSDFRPVPDHQEVWADGATDQSVIIEVVEHSSVPNDQVGPYIFNDLAAVIEAVDSRITSVQQLGPADVPHMPPGTYMCQVTGIQRACKGRDHAFGANTVLVLVCIMRLPHHQSDLLVTVNAPTFINPASIAAQEVDTQGTQPLAQQQAGAIMRGVLQSLQVKDWSLFG